MNSIRQKILEKKLEHMDEKNKKIYRLAERICRKEYEKKYDLDLNLPLGHPKNKVSITQLWDIVSFWVSLNGKYQNRGETPLTNAIMYFCDIHASGMMKIMQENNLI